MGFREIKLVSCIMKNIFLTLLLTALISRKNIKSHENIFDFGVVYNLSFLKEILEHYKNLNLGFQQIFNTTQAFVLDPYGKRVSLIFWLNFTNP